MKRFLDYSGLNQVLARIKAAIDKLGGALTYKGVVDSVSDLPLLVATSPRAGWVYTIKQAGSTNDQFVEDLGTPFEAFTQVAVIYDDIVGYRYTIMGTIFTDTTNVIFSDATPITKDECVYVYTGTNSTASYTIVKYNKYLNPSADRLYERNASGSYTLTSDTIMQTSKSYYKSNITKYTGDVYYTSNGSTWVLVTHGCDYIDEHSTATESQIDLIFEQIFENV